jgi:uncharacterized protein YvpB
MRTGWLSWGGSWYYLDAYNGDMKTGWQSINGSWYYFNGSGRMHTGWLNSGGSWYYLKSGGQMYASSWVTLSGIEYNFNSSGQWCGTKLKVTRRKQQKSNWCWLGSSEMVGKYKNPSSTFTQSSVSNYALGIIPAIWKEPNLPGLHNNVKMAIRKFGSSKITTVGGGNYTRYSLHTIQTMIDGDNPMIMYIRWNASFNFHAVVISGYKNDQLYVIDPWENYPDVYIDYNKAKNNVAQFATGLGKYFGSLTINQ